MKISRIEAVNLIKSCCGNSVNLMIPDKKYYMPKLYDIRMILSRTGFNKYKANMDSFDCDDYSLICHAFVIQERYIEAKKKGLRNDLWLPLAFGECYGNFKNVGGHAMNFALTQDSGFILFEPQNDSDRALDIIDKITFIKM